MEGDIITEGRDERNSSQVKSILSKQTGTQNNNGLDPDLEGNTRGWDLLFDLSRIFNKVCCINTPTQFAK